MKQITLVPLYDHRGEIISIGARADATLTYTFGTEGATGGKGYAAAAANWFNDNRGFNLEKEKITKPYEQHGWFFAAITAKANALASAPFRLVEGDWKSGKQQIVQSYEKIERLFDAPNAQTTGKQFWQLHSKYRDIAGEVLWLFLDNVKTPTTIANASEIYLLDPYEWSAIVDESKEEIIGWRNTRNQYKVKAEFVYHFKEPNPYNQYRGLSRTQVAGLALQTDYLAKQANKHFITNGFNLGGVLTGEDWDVENAKEVKKQLEENYSGPLKQGKIVVLGGTKITYIPNTMTHRNMQYAEMITMNRDEIFAIVGVPESWVSRGSSMNYATLEGEDVGTWQRTMLPVMEEVKEVLWQRHFSKLSGAPRWMQFDYNSIAPLRAALLKGKVELAKKYIELGYPINMVNESLDLGMEPVAWGDEAYFNGAMRPVSLLKDAGDIPDEATAQAMMKEPTPAPVGAQSSTVTTVRVDKTEEERAEYWRQFERSTLVANELRFKREMTKYFDLQRRETVTNLKKLERSARAFTDEEIESILFDMNKWNEKLLKRATPIYEKIASDVTKDIDAQLGGLEFWKEANPAVTKIIELRGAELVKVNETTRDALNKILVEASKENLTVDDTAKLINDFFDVDGSGGRARAFKIARTETASSANGFRNEAFKAEKITKHEWITARDGEVRESHQAQDGDIVTIGEPFANGLKYPGDMDGPPEEVINCRCVVSPIQSDDDDEA